MGYYFTGINNTYVGGIKNGNEYLVMRSDIASKKVNVYYDTIVPKDFGSLSMHMMYPFGIISQHEAKKYSKDYSCDALAWERAAYEKFRPELTLDIVRFKMSDLKVPPDHKTDFIAAVLKIFLYESNKLAYEFSDDVLRVSKTNRITKFFGTTVDTIIMRPIKDIHDIHISEDLVAFFDKKKESMFSIGRADCYFTPGR